MKDKLLLIKWTFFLTSMKAEEENYIQRGKIFRTGHYLNKVHSYVKYKAFYLLIDILGETMYETMYETWKK